MPKLSVFIALLATTTTGAIVIPAHVAPTRAHGAPASTPSEAEWREFSDALTRWTEGNRILALNIHVPFETFAAQAAELVESMRHLHSSIPPPPAAPWRALIHELRDLASSLQHLPVVVDHTDSGLSWAARMTTSALERELDSPHNGTETHDSWRQLRATLEKLLPTHPVSWTHRAVTRSLRGCFEWLAPTNREHFVTPTHDELILTKSVIAIYAELARRTAGTARPDLVPVDLESRATALVTSLRVRAESRQHIATLARHYDEIVARRENALTARGSLDEAQRAFERKRAESTSARAAAMRSLHGTRAAIEHGGIMADAGIARLRSSIERAALQRGSIANADPGSAVRILREAAGVIREATRSTSPMMDLLPGLAEQLDSQFNRLVVAPDLAQRSDTVHGLFEVMSVIHTLGSDGRLAADARATGTLDLLARFLEEASASTPGFTSPMGELNRSLDDVGHTLSGLSRTLSTERARTAEIERLDASIRQTNEVLTAIAAIRDFEGRAWHPALPSPASTNRWSLVEARRLRQALMTPAPGAMSPSDATPELPRLPGELRRVPMIIHSDCAPGA